MLAKIENPTNPIHYFVNRVLLTATRTPNYGLLSVAELGNSMIAGWDTQGELDIYFDRAGWSFKNQDLWQLGDDAVRCDEFGTVRFFGAASGAIPRTFDDALELARRIIQPLPGMIWCQAPRAIDVPLAHAKAA